MRVAWVFALIALLLGGAWGAWTYLDKRQAGEADAAAARATAVEQFFAQPPVDVTAGELVRIWRVNEMAAGQQYLGRPLRIDGHVERVAVENFDGTAFPVLYFAEGGSCVFSWGAPPPELAQLQRGQRIVVLGQPRGPRAGTAHLTTHCSLASLHE